MKITKTLLLCALAGALPASVFVSGCGGGGSGLFAARNYAGSYTGTLQVTSGPDTGQTGSVTLSITSNGTITGNATNAASATSFPFTGSANTTTGAFNLVGFLAQTGTTGNASGSLRINGTIISGTGSFAVNNGDSGTITFVNVAAV